VKRISVVVAVVIVSPLMKKHAPAAPIPWLRNAVMNLVLWCAIQRAKPSGIDCAHLCLSEWYPRMSRLWKSQHFGDNSTIPDNNLMPKFD
jgi:hypothetical protein